MSRASTTTVGDLVNVPPIRAVIQLVDAQQPELRSELLESFVFTDEVSAFFERLLPALQASTGLGAFLKGHYGSGKSHCLTFLQRLLQGDPMAEQRLPPALPRPERPWLVVPIPLTAYSNRVPLESIVMAGVEQSLLEADGARPVLADRTRLLDNFRRLILPHHRDELEGWEELEEEDAARAALEFLRALPDNPLVLSFDRRVTMARLQSLLGERGLVVLLDELSEFLRSKGSGPAYHEDIRYLQFLGEWAQQMPLWIVATLQQSLEELGYGEEESYLRIKERYPLRFTLSARHVSDLVEGRLIRRRPGADEALGKLWRELDEAYPGLIGQARFLRTYPVHPATLELLEGLMPIFSRHRGVVDFIHTRLAGNPLKGEPGLLHEPADRLLTPDAIFDHFEERFSEIGELAPYRDTVWAHLREEIPRLFPQARDREMAEQAVKILILAEARQTPIARDAAGLARMLARRISRLTPGVNVDYLRENVLDVLVKRSSFVARRGQEYYLDLEANLNQLIGRRVRARRPERVDWEPLLQLVNRAELPLAELAAPRTESLKWHNALRQGMTACVDLTGMAYQDFVRTLTRLEEEPLDFALWLAQPREGQEAAARSLLEHARGSRMGAGVVFWLPATPDRELTELALEWLAHERALPDLEGEPQRVARQSMEGMQRKLERGLSDLYAAGKLVWLGGEGPAPPANPMPWPEVLARVLKPRLAELFPRFEGVAPFTDLLSQKSLERLWAEFLAEGRAARPGKADVLIETLAKPLGLVCASSDSYTLRADPMQVPLHAEVCDRLLPEQRVPLRSLALSLQKGPFGLLPLQFALLVAGLIQGGRVTPYVNGRATRLGSALDLWRGKIDELGAAHVLDQAHLDRLPELAWLWPGESLAPLNPARLRALWEQASERLAALAEAARQVHELASQTPACPALPLESLAAQASEVSRKLAAVGSPATAPTGVKRLLEHEVGALEEAARRLPEWSELLRRHGHAIASTWRRLEERGELDGLEQLRSLAHEEGASEAWTRLSAQLAEWEAGQRRAYQEAHRAYYAAPVFQLRTSLTRSPEWSAVEALAGVLGLQSRPTPAELRHRVHELPQPCRLRVEDQLLLGVRCGCGFRPGQVGPEVEDPLPEVRRGLASACEAMVAGPGLDDFIRNLRQVGQEARAERLEQVLATAGELAARPELEGAWPRLATRLSQLLDAPTIEALSRGLTGQVLVAPRRLEDLMGQLEDQRLPVAELRRRFEEWLSGPDLRPDGWVHVQYGREAERKLGAWLSAWLGQHGLEASRAMRRRFPDGQGEPLEGRAEEIEPQLAEVLSDPVAALDPVAGALQERLFERVSRELCQRALVLALEDPAVAGRLLELPAEPWEHLEVAHAVAALLAARKTTYPEVARLLPQWARARHLDLGARLLTPEVESAVEAVLARALDQAPLPDLPLADVPARLVPPGDQPLVVLVVDALRWDLWDLMRPLAEEVLGPPRSESLALSPFPSVTRQARLALLGGDEEAPAGSDGLLLGRPVTLIKSADEKRNRRKVEQLLAAPPPVLMLHLAFVDRRRHETSLELWPLYQELLSEARVRLVPWLKEVRPGYRVLLTADHGFLGVEESERAHGGSRPQERVVPAVLWER